MNIEPGDLLDRLDFTIYTENIEIFSLLWNMVDKEGNDDRILELLMNHRDDAEVLTEMIRIVRRDVALPKYIAERAKRMVTIGDAFLSPN